MYSMTFIPATIAPMTNKVKPNPNPYTPLNQMITITPTLCRRRYHRRSNCFRSKCHITLYQKLLSFQLFNVTKDQGRIRLSL